VNAKPNGGSVEMTPNGGSVEMTRGVASAVITDRCPLGIDVFERAGSLVVHVNLAGIKPKYINVTVAGGVLTIVGQRQEVTEPDSFHCERQTRVFTRSIRLPEDAKAERIESKYRDGVLELTVPRDRLDGAALEGGLDAAVVPVAIDNKEEADGDLG